MLSILPRKKDFNEEDEETNFICCITSYPTLDRYIVSREENGGTLKDAKLGHVLIYNQERLLLGDEYSSKDAKLV